MRDRIQYLDIAKGLLILFIIFFHIGYYQYIYYGGENSIFHNICNHALHWFGILFMPAFCIIHGWYGREGIPFAQEIRNNAIRLLFPIVLLYCYMDTNAAWFCWAMFFALAMRNILMRINNKWIMTALLVVMPFLGSIMYAKGCDWHYFTAALMLTPFIFLGKIQKKYLDNKLLWIASLVGFAVSVFALYHFFPGLNYHKFAPYISGASLPTIKQMSITFLGGISGTTLLLVLSKAIKGNRFIEFVGRNSLIFYLFHFNIIFIELNFTGSFINSLTTPDTYLLSIVIYITKYITIIAGCTGVSMFVNRHCPWVVGKGM